MLRAATFAALCLGLGLAVAQQPASAPAVTMDDIKKAWRDRQDKVKTLELRWDQKLTQPMGTLTSSFEATGKTPKGPEPPKDLLIPGKASFSLADGKYRIDFDRQSWSMDTQKLEPFAYTILFDGEYFWDFYRTPPAEGPQTAFHTKPQKRSGEYQTVELYPIWWMFRGGDDILSNFLLSQFEPTGRTVRVEGNNCLEFAKRYRNTDLVESLYLDRDRGWIPLRFTTARGATATLNLDIQYSPDPVIGWRPTAWSYTQRTVRGKIREALACTVTKCEFNATANESRFRPQLQPGTLVLDTTSGARTQAVVKADGEIGKPIPGDVVVSYEKLKVLSAGDGKSSSYWRLVLLAGLLATCAFAIWFGVRRPFRPRSPQP